MKKTYFFLVAICLFLTSCSSDDEQVEKQESIIGQWFVTAEIWDGEKEPLSDCHAEQYFQFTSEKEVYMKLVDTDDGCDYENYRGTYEVNGNILLLKDIENADELIYNFEIIDLSNNNLIIESSITDIEGEETYRVELEKR